MRYIIGVDEAGRGPLAGPIAVAAVCMPIELNAWQHWEALADSKKLSEEKRAKWREQIGADGRLVSSVAMVSAPVIDREGITRAAALAAARAIARLARTPTNTHILLDAGLRAPETWQQEAFVRGDETIPAIALASIVAKTKRDAYMLRAAKRYPHYGFAQHKGYGTKAHQAAILKHGPCELHRRTFIKVSH